MNNLTDIVQTTDDEEFEDYDDFVDVCYECTGYGDDYYIDQNGEMVCACDDCPFNGRDKWDE